MGGPENVQRSTLNSQRPTMEDARSTINHQPFPARHPTPNTQHLAYAGVIVDADAPGLSQPYTYRVPDELRGAVFVGACVAVPFGGRDLVGYVVELSETAPDIAEIKDLSAVIPDACGLNPPLITLVRWMSEHYLAPLSHSTRAVVPEVMSATVSSSVRLLDPS